MAVEKSIRGLRRAELFSFKPGSYRYFLSLPFILYYFGSVPHYFVYWYTCAGQAIPILVKIGRTRHKDLFKLKNKTENHSSARTKHCCYIFVVVRDATHIFWLDTNGSDKNQNTITTYRHTIPFLLKVLNWILNTTNSKHRSSNDSMSSLFLH